MLYRRSSKEVSFVRTGMFGEKVVISGGAFVLPIIHNITQVGMSTLCIIVKRSGDKALITSDRMRAEILAEFYVRVAPDKKSVAIAAQTLGNRTLDPEHLKELVQGRFVDALSIIAATMTIDEIQENRGKYVKEVTNIAEESIGHTEKNWTQAYNENDNTIKLKYGVKLAKGGIRKHELGKTVDTYRKASIFWTRNPKLVNPMKDRRIWVQVAKNFKPFVALTEEDVRKEFFVFEEKFYGSLFPTLRL
jgi:uncharacterized membrane protein YqiK